MVDCWDSSQTGLQPGPRVFRTLKNHPTDDPPRMRIRFRVWRLILPLGPDGKRPRISLVIDMSRGFPTRIAMRWAVRRRLEGLSAKSLYQYNNTVAWIYDWAMFGPGGVGDLDLFFTEGRVLNRAQLASLIRWIDTRGRPHLIGRIAGGFRLTYSEPEVVTPKLSIIRSFLIFALDPEQRQGKPISERLKAEALQDLEVTLNAVMPAIVTKDRKTPGGRLTDEECDAIRRKIACSDRKISTEVFSLRTAYRNWLLFEVAYATGFRVAELAALTLASLPTHSDMIRLRDDREAGWDSFRREEAGSKTFGRDIPVPEWLLEHLQAYADEYRAPWGRKGTRGVPALWTRGDGLPLSVRQIERIFQKIGNAVGFRLTVHRPRHRFVDNALSMMDAHAAKEITGHSSVRSLQRYTHEMTRKRAEDFHREAYRRQEADRTRMRGSYP